MEYYQYKLTDIKLLSTQNNDHRRDVRFSPDLAHNGTNPRIIKMSFQYILARQFLMVVFRSLDTIDTNKQCSTGQSPPYRPRDR